MGCSTQLLNFPLVDEITTLLQCKPPRSFAMYNLHITTIFKNDTFLFTLALVCQCSVTYFLVIFSSGLQGKFRITTSLQNGTHIFISKYCHLLNTHMYEYAYKLNNSCSITTPFASPAICIMLTTPTCYNTCKPLSPHPMQLIHYS
jgi:hypothetical protein